MGSLSVLESQLTCMHVCACVFWGVVPSHTQVLLGLVPPPPLPPVPIRALTPPGPRCQPPAPAICCGRCLAVPWQRQNRMYLWIAAGTSPCSQAALAFPCPKACWVELLGSRSGANAVFMGERQSQHPPRGQWQGRGRTPRHIPAEIFPVCGACMCSSLPLRVLILREQVGREAGGLQGWFVGVTSVFPTIIATTHQGIALGQDLH